MVSHWKGRSRVLISLSHFSSLRRYERSLSWMALSRLESNGALAQLLAELPREDEEEKDDSSSSPASIPSANS